MGSPDASSSPPQPPLQQKQSQHQQLSKTRPRQSPGAACEECRRRKLRCDRKMPQCGVCATSGVLCQFNNTRPERGPKKGNLQQLQQRMAALEERLMLATENSVLVEDPMEMSKDPMAVDMAKVNPIPPCSPDGNMSVLNFRLPESPPLPVGTEVPVLMREELDQLYFDRVHIFAPIIHQTRYACWKSQTPKSESKEALQYAMWTLAASFSAQFQQVAQSLYQEAQRMLDMLKDTEIETIEIEHLQACLLLATYEFMNSYDRRSWMRAGYAFRLVQLIRLYEIDTPLSSATHDNWVEVEEKRRTFWMAFCLDRFLSIRNGWPLTLIEHLITTRLPAPEAAFQGGHPVIMEFLSDAIASNGPVLSSPFTESVMVATVCGRALIHHYQAMVESNYNTAIRNFHDRHEWIHSTLKHRLDILAGHTPTIAENSDPLLLFTCMLAQTTVLYLYHTIELSAYEMSDMGLAAVAEYEEVALLAAQEMVQLTRTLSQTNSFKIHPFTPIPLSLCADFFNAYRDPNTTFSAKLQEIFHELRNLRCVNSLSDKILQVLELSKGPEITMSQIADIMS
ncbi:fungal-specific transcription factor domain-containing protein [Aspergillus avenaceus]|uniref:Fungal-specific transcription factor domain-containing protein n=1 Tax=Aspergillus avenaceus TaxID=36643 RepID=A0A5N6TQ83_ASPAV|nr:fungal-specific transcription factor domain-containing protein [Aspergillus avenaceus]